MKSSAKRDYERFRSIVGGNARDTIEKVQLHVSIRKINEEKQIVTGEVYAPFIIDSHGDMMEPEDVELLAHRFMAEQLNNRIDILHNNMPAHATAVESYIASKGHPEFNDGAWILSVKVYDEDVWADIKTGKLAGYSMEALVRKVDALVELEIQKHVWGIVEENDGHDHAFFVLVDDDGRVVGGRTSKDNGHSHEVRFGTATELTNNHKHRFFLP